jgi:TolB-like protein
MFTDIVGYTALMAESEERGLRARERHREVVRPLVERYHGESIEARGDESLSVFPTALDAVNCALAIEAELEGNHELRLHLGIHLGDLVVHDGEASGDGVNIASRICALSEGGGLCVSGEVHRSIRNQPGIEVTPLGERTLKNVPEPVTVYSVTGLPAAPRSIARPIVAPRRRALPGAVLVTAIAVAVALWATWPTALRLLPGASGIDDQTGTGGVTEDRRSVAVLPFENVSRLAVNEPFTIGIHDDLLTHLSKIRSIKTISRTSVLQYRDTSKAIAQIARELGVATILAGGVQRAGDRVRINVRLIDAAADQPLWAETYDRQLNAANVFAIQSEIARAIAETLSATLSREERQRLESAPTLNLAAMETYFLGKQLLERRTSESLAAAIEYFQQVIELDPDFALAHSGLADAYMLLPEYSATADWALSRQKSEAAANRALALDPDLPEALSSMGWNRLIHYYDWKGAEALLRRALEVQSNNTNALHWLSHVLSWQGEHEEAIRWATRALEVDPLSRLMRMNLSYILMDSGDFDRAIEIGNDAVARHPDYPEQHGNLWLTYLRAGRPEEGADALQRWAAGTGRDVQAAREVGELCVHYRRTGKPQKLPTELADRLELLSDDLGQVYAFIGDGEGALLALERAYEERSGSRSVLSMKLNPGYDFIRDDPRFVDLMQRAGLRP